MAITHSDLARRRQGTDVSSRLGLFLVIAAVLCGIISFVLCLAAEASRSEATKYLLSNQGDGSNKFVCSYSGSGRTPLSYAVCTFVLLALAMFLEHAYLLIAATSSKLPSAASTLPNQPVRLVPATTSHTMKTCCLFLASWVCFAIAEVLLLIGIAVESGHLTEWTRPKPGCHVLRPGVFASAGILGVITVLLGMGLYLSIQQAQKLYHEEDYRHRGIGNETHHQFNPSAPQQPNAMQDHEGKMQTEKDDSNKVAESA